MPNTAIPRGTAHRLAAAPSPAVPWRVSAEAALAPQSHRRRLSIAVRLAVVVAVGLETVVNVVVQLGSTGHTAAAIATAYAAPPHRRHSRRSITTVHAAAAAAPAKV